MKKVFGFLLLFFCQVIYGIEGYRLQEGSLNDCELLMQVEGGLSQCSATLLKVIPLSSKSIQLKLATIKHCLENHQGGTLICSDGKNTISADIDAPEDINFPDNLVKFERAFQEFGKAKGLNIDGLVIFDTIAARKDLKKEVPEIKIATLENLYKINLKKNRKCYVAGASSHFKNLSNFKKNKTFTTSSKRVFINNLEGRVFAKGSIAYKVESCHADDSTKDCATVYPGDSGGGFVCKLSSGERYLIGAHSAKKKGYFIGHGRLLTQETILKANFQDNFIVRYKKGLKAPHLYTFLQSKWEAKIKIPVELLGTECKNNFLKKMYQNIFPEVIIEDHHYFSPQTKITINNQRKNMVRLTSDVGRESIAEIIQSNSKKSFLIDGKEVEVIDKLTIAYDKVSLKQMNTHYYVTLREKNEMEINENPWNVQDNSNMQKDYFEYRYSWVESKTINSNIESWGCEVYPFYRDIPGEKYDCYFNAEQDSFICSPV